MIFVMVLTVKIIRILNEPQSYEREKIISQIINCQNHLFLLVRMNTRHGLVLS